MSAKEYIDQYGQILGELQDLKDELYSICGQPAPEQFDAVVGSSKEIPYQKHSIALHGFAQAHNIVESKNLLAEQYKTKMAKLYDVIRDMESVFDKISDTKKRRVVRLKCVNGLEWQEIADRLNKGNDEKNTEDSVKKIYQRVINNL